MDKVSCKKFLEQEFPGLFSCKKCNTSGFPTYLKSENLIDLPCNVKKLLKRITISNSTECFPSPEVPLVSTRNLVVRDIHVFAKPLMEKGGIDVWCVADHKISSLIRYHFFSSKGNYCYNIQPLLFSRFSQMQNEQFTITGGNVGSIWSFLYLHALKENNPELTYLFSSRFLTVFLCLIWLY